MNNLPNITPEMISAYQQDLEANSSPATAKRRAASLKKFFNWAEDQGHIPQNPYPQPMQNVPMYPSPIPSIEPITPSQSEPKKKNAGPYIFTGTMTLALLVIIFLLLGKVKFSIPFELPSASDDKSVVTENTNPNTSNQTIIASAYKIFADLSLKNGSGQPITTPQTVSFKVYSSPTGQDALYTSPTQQITPSQTGSVSTVVENIPTELFFENKVLYIAPVTAEGEIAERIPVSTANVASNLQGHFPKTDAVAGSIPVIGTDGSLLLASDNPAIKGKTGNLLIEGKMITIASPTASDGDITINPDGSGKINLITEGSSGNVINATATNLNSGTLYSGIVANSSTGYYLIKLQGGSTPTTKFSVDAQGNTFMAGSMDFGGGLKVGGVERITNLGNLTNINGYSGTGVFNLSQTASNYFGITKVGVTAATDSATLSLNETGVTASGYDTLVLNRIGGDSNAYALNVATGNAKFGGNMVISGSVDLGGLLELGNFAAAPSSAGEGSMFYNTSDSTVYVYDGSTWNPVGSGGASDFASITDGTNTTAAMVVGSGASLTPTGTGIIEATELTCTGCVLGTEIAADTLDFSNFSDSMSLDASTNINLGSNTLSTSGTGAMDFNSTGQVSFAGNINAENGLDVTNANFTVGGANFSIDYSTGDTTTAGDILVNGGNITTTSSNLWINPNGTLTLGTTSQPVTLQGSTNSISSSGTGNDITLTSADQIIFNAGSTIEAQDNINVTGDLSTTGNVAVNGGNLTSTAATLIINAAGNVDVQDVLNADSITTDTGGVTIAASQSYTGLGAVTYRSANASTLTINSGTTGSISIGTDASDEVISIGNGTASKTMTIGSVTGGSMLSLQGGTNGINLGDDGIAKTIDIGGTDSDAANTIRIGTGSTSADAITIGNSNASTTLGLTGGTAWSISTTGNLTTSGDIYVNGDDIFSDGNLTLDATSTVIIPDTDTFQTNDVTSTGALNVTSNTTNAATFDSGTTGAVNIGTGANSKTITLGNTSTSTSVVLTKGASGNITLTGFNCTSFANGGTLTTDSSGNITCTDDNAATGGSGSVAWNDITAPTNDLSLSHSGYATSMSWTATGTLSPWTMNLTNNAGSSTSQNFMTLNNAVTTQTGDVNTEALLLLNNADTSATGSTVVDNAILITNSGGISNGITDAIDATAADIVNALNFGANTILGTTGDIDMTNFDVVGSSGNITTAGTLAVNGDSITADGATLVINAAGTVDIQDSLTANDITTDTGGVSIASGQSYTGAGAVTLSSAAGSTLTINSGTTGGIDIGTDASAETLQIGNGAAVKTITLGSTNTTSTTTIQSGSGDLTLSSTDRIFLSSSSAGANGTNELFSLTAGSDLANSDELIAIGDSIAEFFIIDGEGNIGISTTPDSMIKLYAAQTIQGSTTAKFDFFDDDTVTAGNTYQDVGIESNTAATGNITSDAIDAATRSLYSALFQATDTGNLTNGGQLASKDVRGISAVGEDLALSHVSGTSNVYGGHFTANGASANVTGTAYGIYATATGADTNYAGYFVGDIYGSTDLTLAGDLNVNGGDLATTAITFNIGVGNTGTINFTDGTYDLVAIKDQGDYPFLNIRGKSDTGDPATCAEGDIYYNAADDAVKVCHTGNTWEDLDGGTVPLWISDTGTLYPATITDNVGIGTQTAADIISKLYITNDSTETGKALAIFDQTEDEDIFSASASSITKFKIAKNATEYDVVIDRYIKNLTDSLNSVDLNNGSNGLGFRSSKNVNFYLDQDSNNTDEAFSISTNNGTANLLFVEGLANGGGVITPQIGIGTQTPETYLHVAGATDGKALVILSETGNQNILTASAGASTVFNLDRSGNISSTGVFQVGDPSAANSTTFNRIGTNSPAESADISTNEDLLISEDLEIDGTLYLVGNIIANRESTGSIILCADGSLDCSDPTQVVNSLTAGSWTVQNTSNVGKAALMVVQDNNKDLFTASASSDTKFTIHNDGSLTLEGMASTTNTDEATVYYDTDVDHLYLRGGDSAWHRVALDMTKYSANDASVDNQDYVEIAHNQNTNDISVLGWFMDTVSGLWTKITDWTTQITQDLANEFNPVYAEKVKTTEVQLAYQENDFGTGADGVVSISTAGTYSLNTTNYISGRSCADGGDAVNYSVTALTSNTATVAEIPISSGCLAVGDEMLIINMRGTTSSVVNVGNYETLRISSIDTTNGIITFTSNKTKYYGSGASDNLNIGVNSTDQTVMIQRVPNYTNFTVGTGVTITPDQWVGSTGASTHGPGEGGVLFFRANGTTTITGNLSASAYGYVGGVGGGTATYGGAGGESICSAGGTGNAIGAGGNGAGGGGGSDNYNGGNGSCGGGGGAGDSGTTGGTGSASSGGAGGGGGEGAGGGGGGHVTAGIAGKFNATVGNSGGDNTSGNGSVGTASNLGGQGGGGGSIAASTNLDLAKLYMGSAGGGGGDLNLAAGKGGDGGGIIFVASSGLTVSGTVSNNGETGTGVAGTGTYAGGGGGGAAGSTKIIGNSLTLGTGVITATGGSGGTGSYNGTEGGASAGGAGGDGRITIYYSSLPTGTTSPSYNAYTLNYNTYSVFVSNEVSTPKATEYNTISWTEDLDTNGEIQVQTRSGDSTDSTDGTWTSWGGATTLSLNNANTHSDWSGTNATVADGDVTRNIDYYEDEDEFTIGNLTKITSSTSGGYAQHTYGSTWDLSTYDYLTFWIRSSTGRNSVKIGISEDGSTWQEENITIDAIDTWQKVYWDISDIASGSRDAINRIRITKLGTTTDTIYIDNFNAESYGTTASGQDISGTTANNYIQYRFILSTTDTVNTPTFSAVRLTYNDTVIIDADDVRTISDPYYYSSSRNRLTNIDLANYKNIRSVTGMDYFGQQGQYDPGTGADGAISITLAGTYSLNTTNYISGRSCADGGDAVNYSVTALTSNTTTVESNPSSGCLQPGDEVLLINLRGTSSSTINTGNYETLRVASVIGSTINFQTAKTKYYGSGSDNDSGIGLDSGSQIVMLQRIPNYTNVTIGSGVTVGPDDWESPAGISDNGNGEGGVLFFRATGTVSIGGSLSATSKGYIGGPAVAATTIGGTGGESICGSGGAGGNGSAGAAGAAGGGGDDDYDGGNGSCGGGGGAGDSSHTAGTGSSASGGAGGGGGQAGGGGGGGYGGAGAGGYISTTAATSGGENTSGNGTIGTALNIGGAGGGGGSYGNSNLSRLYLGSAGGAGGGFTGVSGKGGDGGGILVISVANLSVSGTIASNGESGGNGASTYGGGGGGAAGGSIKLIGSSLSLGTGVTSSAGSGGTGYYNSTSGQSNGGNGGVGRIAVYSTDSITGTTTPTAATASIPNYNYSLFISDEIPTPNATQYSNIKWVEDLGSYGMIQMQTRSGKSNNSTDESWEEWRPVTTDTNTKSLQTMDTHGDWTSGVAPSDITIADGDITRNVNYFEDEDESVTGNITKFSSVGSTTGYAEETITSVDLSNYDYITTWVEATSSGNLVKFGFGESSSTENEKTFHIDNANTWQKIYWDISDIDPSLRNAVTKLRITVPTVNTTVYVDNITADRYLSVSEGSPITSTPNEFIQYRAILTTAVEGYYPKVHNVTIDWSNGYKLVQTDANTVRLYNFTGQTQNIRLDAIVFGADLAEWYTVNSIDIEPGDIVATTGLTDDYGVPILRKATSVSDKGLIGGISTKAGKELGLEAEDRRLLALAGRIPVKMSDSSLPIKSGDGITSSIEPGKGQKAKVGQMIIGKALEDWSEESGKKTVMVLVGNSIQTVNPEEAQQYAVTAANTIEEGAYVVATQAGETLDNVGAFAAVIAANIQAGLIETQELVAQNIQSQEVNTKIISPLAGETDVNIQVGSATESGVLAIQNADGTTVSAFDSEGNATISGSLTTNEIRTGTIYADRIIANGGKFTELASSTQSAITRDEVEDLLRSAEQDILALQNNLNSSIHTATDSANLDNITATNMYLSDSLITNAITTSNTLTVGNDFVISSTIEDDIEQIAMNTLTAPLRIQSLAMAPVEIMAGKFRIDTNGDVSIDGNLYVAGDIYAQGLNLSAVEENKDLLTLRSKDNNQVARVDASGSASFGSLTTDKIVIAGSETATDSAVINGEIRTNATAGKTYIPSNTNEIIIRNPKVSSYTLVYVTPTSDTQNLVLYVKEKGDGYFKVGFTSPITTDVNFNWWIIEIQ